MSVPPDGGAQGNYGQRAAPLPCLTPRACRPSKRGIPGGFAVHHRAAAEWSRRPQGAATPCRATAGSPCPHRLSAHPAPQGPRLDSTLTVVTIAAAPGALNFTFVIPPERSGFRRDHPAARAPTNRNRDRIALRATQRTTCFTSVTPSSIDRFSRRRDRLRPQSGEAGAAPGTASRNAAALRYVVQPSPQVAPRHRPSLVCLIDPRHTLDVVSLRHGQRRRLGLRREEVPHRPTGCC